jgi:hypothetical protein
MDWRFGSSGRASALQINTEALSSNTRHTYTKKKYHEGKSE